MRASVAVPHHQGVPVFVSCFAVAFQMGLDFGREREHPPGTCLSTTAQY